MGTKIWKIFPFNSNYWLQKLPPFIRILLGTKEFERAVNVHFNLSCWHRTAKDCSNCRYNFRIYPNEVNNYLALLQFRNESNGTNSTIEEIEMQSDEEIRFWRSLSIREDSEQTFDDESDES